MIELAVKVFAIWGLFNIIFFIVYVIVSMRRRR